MKHLSKYGPGILFLFIAVFFCFFYNYHLLYVEQLQLFQFTELYFQSLINKPGGMADYLGAFFTQFYAWNHTGGLLLTVALLLLFTLQKRIARSWELKVTDTFLLIPPVICTLFFMDINARFGALAAVLTAMGFAWGVSCFTKRWMRYTAALLLVPVIYGSTGGGLIVYTSLLAIHELLRGGKNTYFLMVLLLFSLVFPLYVRQYLIPLSWNDTWFGTAFYQGNNRPVLIWYILFSPALGCLLATWSSRITAGSKHANRISVLLACCIIGGSSTLICCQRNPNEEMLYTLDHLFKKKEWEEMVRIASEHPYRNPVFVSYVNLALLNLGKLPDQMMYFSQRANINEFWTSSYLPMFLTGETYYYLDMYDGARAYLYMANTQSPSGQSPYMFQRLAELEIIRGNSRSGMKYIHALKQTLRYRDWAEEMEQAVLSGKYPEHLRIPMAQYTENDSFLAKEMLYNVACKHREDPENPKVRDFLLAKYILANDYKGFIHCISNLPHGTGRTFPRSYQEFLLMYAYMLRDNTLIAKWNIPQDVVTSFYRYLQINQSGQSPEEIKKQLSGNFRQSYWFYVQYTNEF